jgi:phage shock protein PspC (stress-responsive transcriptional regulator)
MVGNKGYVPLIIGNRFLFGCGFFIFGLILAGVSFYFALSLGLDGGANWWSNFFGVLMCIGLGLMVAGPLVWWIIIPIRSKKRRKNAQ